MEFEFEQVAGPGQVQGAGLGPVTQALGRQIGHVVGAEGLQFQKVLEQSDNQRFAVDLAQGDDALDLDHRIVTALAQTLVIRLGDGSEGQEADELTLLVGPQALVQQLKRGGKMIIPVGSNDAGAAQQLKLIDKRGMTVIEKQLDLVRFVPMLGGLAK